MDVDLLQECHSSGVSEDHPVAGIPAYAYGPGLLDGSHGPDEAVEIEDIYRCALVNALASVRLLSRGVMVYDPSVRDVSTGTPAADVPPGGAVPMLPHSSGGPCPMRQKDTAVMPRPWYRRSLSRIERVSS